MTRSAPGRTATAGTSRPVFSSHRRVRNRRASSVDSNGTAASFTVDSDTEIHVTRARVPHHVDEIDSIVLNTSRSLFRVASVRRAVAYAVDREALLHATGFLPGKLTDQIHTRTGTGSITSRSAPAASCSHPAPRAASTTLPPASSSASPSPAARASGAAGSAVRSHAPQGGGPASGALVQLGP
jgi:hypothetical protein